MSRTPHQDLSISPFNLFMALITTEIMRLFLAASSEGQLYMGTVLISCNSCNPCSSPKVSEYLLKD